MGTRNVRFWYDDEAALKGPTSCSLVFPTPSNSRSWEMAGPHLLCLFFSSSSYPLVFEFSLPIIFFKLLNHLFPFFVNLSLKSCKSVPSEENAQELKKKTKVIKLTLLNCYSSSILPKIEMSFSAHFPQIQENVGAWKENTWRIQSWDLVIVWSVFSWW